MVVKGEMKVKSEELVTRIWNHVVNDLELDKLPESFEVGLNIIVDDYDIVSKSTELAPLNNMYEMIQMYIMTRKIEGLSEVTLKNYFRNLSRFSRHVFKNVKDVTTMDIRVYLAKYSQTGVKNSTISTHTDILRGFFGFLTDEEYIGKQ